MPWPGGSAVSATTSNVEVWGSCPDLVKLFLHMFPSPSLSHESHHAILQLSFMKQAVWFPTIEEKVEAKDWVEVHSCRAWQNGWLFVDGTLVPLFDHPHWYSKSYIDRKCNYSLNIQVCLVTHSWICTYKMFICRLSHCWTYTLLNLVMAIQADDSTAWDETHLAREHTTILEGDEFVWADSAYPVELSC